MSSQPHSPTTIQKTNPYLTPAYLLSLSSHIQTLSSFYQQQNLPSLSLQYKSFLQSTFKNLSNCLNVFSQDQSMIISSLLSTKVELQFFVGQKLYLLLEKQTGPLAEILKFVLSGYKKNSQDFEELLIREKKRKIQFEHQKNDRVVNNLKKQVLIKRQYVKQLQDRIKDLQAQNSKIYQKIIDNAKNTISTTLIQSKAFTNNASQYMTPGKYSKLSLTNQQQSSPVSLKISHKQMSLKQVQQTIIQILTLKRKQQSISLKRSSLKGYIKYYFKHKFGLNELCEQMKSNFMSAIKHFLSSNYLNNQLGYNNNQNIINYVNQQQQKPLLLLFNKLINQEIDQYYFWNQYIIKGIKIIKIFKRYLNQKQKIQIKQLDKLYDGYQGISGSISNYSTNKIIFNQQEKIDFQLDQNDVRHILCNVYTKSKEIETLQMIFAEIIGKQQNNQSNNWISKEQNTIIMSRMRPTPSPRTTVLSKHLLGIILCYEIQSYCIKISSLANYIRKYSLSSQYTVINYIGLEKIILQMKIDEQKYMPYLQQNYQDLKDKQFTFSEIIQIIDGQICGQKNDPKYNLGNYNSRKI